MLEAAIAIFLLAAVGGAYLLSYVLTDKPTPKAIALLHGAAAASALLLLILYTLGPEPDPLGALVILVLAALGGFVLIYRDLTGQTLPKWLAVGHGLTALTGFVFLVLHAFRVINF